MLGVCGGIRGPGEILLGRHDEVVVNDLPAGITADLHHAFEHGLAHIRSGKARDDKETVLLPLLLPRCVDHGFILAS